MRNLVIPDDIDAATKLFKAENRGDELAVSELGGDTLDWSRARSAHLADVLSRHMNTPAVRRRLVEDLLGDGEVILHEAFERLMEDHVVGVLFNAPVRSIESPEDSQWAPDTRFGDVMVCSLWQKVLDVLRNAPREPKAPPRPEAAAPN